VTAATLGQALYVRLQRRFLESAPVRPSAWLQAWDDLETMDVNFLEDAAQGVIDVFLAGDSVSAESIREALAAQEPEPAGEPLTHFFHCWRSPSHHACAVALIERQQEENDRLLVRSASAERELTAAKAETQRMRDVVCKLLDLFGKPDERRMRHASVTAATLERYAAEAGVKP
jgi:hypothetical protein